MTQHLQPLEAAISSSCQCREIGCHGELGVNCGQPAQLRLVPVRELRTEISLCPACAREGLNCGRLAEAPKKDVAYGRLAYVLNLRENRVYAATASEFRLEWLNKDGTAQFEHRWRSLHVKVQADGHFQIERGSRPWWQTYPWYACGIGLIWMYGQGNSEIRWVLVIVVAVFVMSRIVKWREKRDRLRNEVTRYTDLFWSGKMQHPRKATSGASHPLNAAELLIAAKDTRTK